MYNWLMSNPIRLFIAIELSQLIHDELSALLSDLKKFGWKSAKWVRPESIHLTLKFLGDTDPSKVESLKSILAEVCNHARPFTILVKGTGVFPSRDHPRVLWTGVTPSDELGRLHNVVEDAMSRLGYKKEERLFSPHLTLARIPSIGEETAMETTLERLFEFKNHEFGSVIVRRITLFQSTLASGGSIYTPLAYIRLLE